MRANTDLSGPVSVAGMALPSDDTARYRKTAAGSPPSSPVPKIYPTLRVDAPTFETIRGNTSSTQPGQRAGKLSHFAIDMPSESHKTMSLTWQDLTYTVQVETRDNGKKVEESKIVLDALTGAVKPGDMMCVMGTSGSGKTSFLNLLAGRYFDGVVSGKVLCNNAPRGSSYKHTIGYVEQDDLMFPNLTVSEMLVYTALLRLPKHYSRADKVRRAEEVIEQLGLSDCGNSRIGSPGRRGISGGERKRTSIGMELITNPQLLFMDEPTSGLDAYTAFHVMETVKKLTQSGRAVICSIHQPRDKTFKLFDKLLLLAKGRTCFYGPTTTALDYMSSIGYQCPQHENIADFLLDITTIDTRTPMLHLESQRVVDKICEAYALSKYNKAACSEADGADEHGLPPIVEDSGPATVTRARISWGTEYFILLSRAFKLIRREPRLTTVAFVQCILISLITGTLYYQLEHDQIGIKNRLGALFFMVLNVTLGALQPTLLYFHAEKQVFDRERLSASYRVGTYFFSKTTSDLPIWFAPLLPYIVITYFMIGLKMTVTAVFKTLLMLMLVLASSQSIGLCISAVTPSLAMAQAISPIVMMLVVMFGGFYLQINSIPIYLKPIEAFSFLQYGFIGLVRVQFEGELFSCERETYCLPTGEAVMEDLGVFTEEDSYWAQVGKLVTYIIGFRVLAYLGLRYLHKKKLRFD